MYKLPRPLYSGEANALQELYTPPKASRQPMDTRHNNAPRCHLHIQPSSPARLAQFRGTAPATLPVATVTGRQLQRPRSPAQIDKTSSPPGSTGIRGLLPGRSHSEDLPKSGQAGLLPGVPTQRTCPCAAPRDFCLKLHPEDLPKDGTTGLAPKTPLRGLAQERRSGTFARTPARGLPKASEAGLLPLMRAVQRTSPRTARCFHSYL
ncbi:hypothetical protein HPB48_018071 [Haemaphysalis longicornis]|uniref:Uncharacterized protein n=1 Tax=Haemaphysalis longicornis TaxID=44386 RepID=A0A9J6FTD2_HAELO|nr:hypothetical protein HPB48_018071 [Haemaphysalis longicornis]